MFFLSPQDVIIFMIGGATYEEARTISLYNQDPATALKWSSPTWSWRPYAPWRDMCAQFIKASSSGKVVYDSAQRALL